MYYRKGHLVETIRLRREEEEWVKPSKLEDYYQPAMTSPNVRFELFQDEMRRRIVSVAVLRDDLVMQLVKRGLTREGVHGLGRTGLLDLKRMLAEEHLELY